LHSPRELSAVCGTLSDVRWALVGTLGMSLVAHGVVAAFLFVPRAGVAPDLDPPPPPPLSAGETFELPAPATADTPLANASPSPDTNAAPAPVEFPDAPARPMPPSKAKTAARPSHQGRPSAGHAPPGQAEGAPGGPGSALMFGAVGERAAADLTRAFTRGFPQAASGDPIWRNVPLGSAGDAIVVLTLDESGHVSEVQIIGNASGPLAQGIWRTMALIKGRPFVARSKVTKLHLTAAVRADSVHDGLHGDVFAIGNPTDESAFFALNVGRRVDLRVRAE